VHNLLFTRVKNNLFIVKELLAVYVNAISIKHIKWTIDGKFLNNKIINIAVHSLKKKLTLKDVYVINLLDIATYNSYLISL
jgi:hypothetical protein